MSLRIGLSGEAVRRYADEWPVSVRDVTPLAHGIHARVSGGDPDAAARLLPEVREGLLDALWPSAAGPR